MYIQCSISKNINSILQKSITFFRIPYWVAHALIAVLLGIAPGFRQILESICPSKIKTLAPFGQLTMLQIVYHPVKTISQWRVSCVLQTRTNLSKIKWIFRMVYMVNFRNKLSSHMIIYLCPVLIRTKQFLPEICNHFSRWSNTRECQPDLLIQRLRTAYCTSSLTPVSCAVFP